MSRTSISLKMRFYSLGLAGCRASVRHRCDLPTNRNVHVPLHLSLSTTWVYLWQAASSCVLHSDISPSFTYKKEKAVIPFYAYVPVGSIFHMNILPFADITDTNSKYCNIINIMQEERRRKVTVLTHPYPTMAFRDGGIEFLQLHSQTLPVHQPGWPAAPLWPPRTPGLWVCLQVASSKSSCLGSFSSSS